MHTGPHTATQSQPAPGPGRGGALLIGGIAFAIVFLLIVGGTVGFLVLRGGGGGGNAAGTTTPSASQTPSGPTTTPSQSLKPYEEGEWCWSADRDRTSENPPGRLRGGGLEFVPPKAYNGRGESTAWSFATDLQTATAPVEGTWASTASIGKVVWQTGYEYPGAEVASQRIRDCLISTGRVWQGTSQRTVSDEFTEPVTIAGMPGYKSSAVLNFGKHQLKKTSATAIVVVVVDTPEGPSMFATDTSVGVKEHEDAADDALASLSGLSG